MMRTLKILSVAVVSLAFGFNHPAVAEEKIVNPVKVVGAGDGAESAYDVSPKVSLEPPSAEAYPEGAVIHAYQEELYELKRAEEAERKAVRARDDYERKKVEAEKEISAKRFQIEGYKMKQEQAASEVESMSIEMTDLEKQHLAAESDLRLIEQRAAAHFTLADDVRRNLAETKAKLEDSLDRLKAAKELTAKNINKNNIEVQKMRAETAVLEAEVESVESQKATLEAEEYRSRTEWVAIKKQIEEKNAEKAKSLASLNDSKKKLESAQKDYRVAKNELDSAEKSRAETEVRVMAEVKKLDESTYAAQRSKAMAAAEKIRVEAEAEKLKAYVAMVKKSNTESIDAMKDSQSAVMESRLALETAKSELTREVASGEKENFKRDKLGARLRGLASVAEASDMLEGAKPWMITKACKIQRRPSSKSEVLGEVSSGQKLVGSESAGSWVKILNSSGAPAFVKSECGQFE